MFIAKFKKGQIKPCTACLLQHYPGIKCQEIPCVYCDSTHNIRDYKEGMCPTIYDKTTELREKKLLVCPDCKGLGTYKKIEYVTMEEDQGLYKKRVQEWSKDKKADKDAQKPQKMIFKHSIIETKIACATCDQQGLVKQRRFCCITGCSKCGYQGIVENPIWKRVKLQLKKVDVPIGENISCTICTQTMESQDLTYPLQCGHKFHKICIINWFAKQTVAKTCPLCRSTENYYPYGSTNSTLANKSPTPKYASNVRLLERENVMTKYRSRTRDRSPEVQKTRFKRNGFFQAKEAKESARPLSDSSSVEKSNKQWALRRRLPVLERKAFLRARRCSPSFSSSVQFQRKKNGENLRNSVVNFGNHKQNEDFTQRTLKE